jgi:AcrR family transcriptional regulator
MPPSSRPSPARERLISTAADLFYRYGCHATGIDTVIAQAGVAKMTLYKHFPSKDDLVAATVSYLDELYSSRFAVALSGEGEPEERLLRFFDIVSEWAQSGDFFGCPFVNLSAEYPAHDNPVHVAAAKNKQRMLGVIERLVAECGAKSPAELARQLQILLEGSVALAQVSGSVQFVADARAAAKTLLAGACSN